MKKPLRTFVALAFFVGMAHADVSNVNLDVNNPMTVVIKHSMQQRVSRLVKFYEPGVIGQARDGNIVIHDSSRLTKLATRQIVEKLIDAENSDRKELIAAIAVANKRAEALEEIRLAMARHWVQSMKPGWWYQDDSGAWVRKQ